MQFPRKNRMASSIILVVVVAVSQVSQGQPPQKRPFQRDRVHDPSTIVKHKNEFWVFCTGMGVPSFCSKDLVAWEPGPPVFAKPPAWITEVVPKHRGYFWAPDVIRVGERYLLYYSVSAFGKNTSAIALASNPTLDPSDPAYKWTDHGIVFRSQTKDDFNAIDPNVFSCPDGSLWMALGSFWNGIKLVELDPKSGLRKAADSPLYSLANKEQIEAVAIYRHGEHYYQFVNWGWCCRGTKSTYNIRVGRSRDVRGPYLDKEGKDLRQGGGSLLLATEGRFIGPGHPGVLQDGERFYLSYHFYDGDDNGRPRLAVRRLEWSADGWPKLVGDAITPVKKK
jgi:arabinan endo-1,5-alpha-L-arabinosidase